jgi:hypothetical protein
LLLQFVILSLGIKTRLFYSRGKSIALLIFQTVMWFSISPVPDVLPLLLLLLTALAAGEGGLASIQNQEEESIFYSRDVIVRQLQILQRLFIYSMPGYHGWCCWVLGWSLLPGVCLPPHGPGQDVLQTTRGIRQESRIVPGFCFQELSIVAHFLSVDIK